MADFLLPTRAAMMKALRRDVGVLEFIPAASIYPATVPAQRAFPFIRFGTMLAAPFRASGLDSSAFRISVQAFTKDVVDGANTIVRPAEDNAILIGAAIQSALDGTTLPIAPDMHLRLVWLQSSPTIDGTEAGAWMTTVTFNGEVAG